MLLLLPKLTATTSGVSKTDSPTDTAVGVRPVFYCNRTLRHWMNIQAMRNRNVLLGVKDYDGSVDEGYRSVPIKTLDQIINAEATVA